MPELHFLQDDGRRGVWHNIAEDCRISIYLFKFASLTIELNNIDFLKSFMINKILYTLYHNWRAIITWLFWGYVALILALYLIDIKVSSVCFTVFFFLFGLWLGSCLSYWLRDEVKYRDLDE